ncbi:hypothetical protein Landi51_02874 [Colletotrichum acutatum]
MYDGNIASTDCSRSPSVSACQQHPLALAWPASRLAVVTLLPRAGWFQLPMLLGVAHQKAAAVSVVYTGGQEKQQEICPCGLFWCAR